MSEADPTDSPLPEGVGEQPVAAGLDHGRDIADIRQDFGNTVEDIKEKFVVLLDLRDRKIEQLEEKLAEGKKDQAKRRLLLIDDAESTREIVNWHLQNEPVEMVSATADKAREHLCSGDYDVIMIEATVRIGPDVDGLALCGELCGKGGDQSVIVMSSHPGERIRNSVEQAGAVLLQKPFRREQLLKLLRGTLLAEKE